LLCASSEAGGETMILKILFILSRNLQQKSGPNNRRLPSALSCKL